MGKKRGKWKYKMPLQTVLDAINTRPISDLMPVAKVVCGSDYAVRFYNKNHPKFYRNKEAFRHALRRCVAFNAFDHVDTIIRYLHLETENYTEDAE